MTNCIFIIFRDHCLLIVGLLHVPWNVPRYMCLGLGLVVHTLCITEYFPTLLVYHRSWFSIIGLIKCQLHKRVSFFKSPSNSSPELREWSPEDRWCYSAFHSIEIQHLEYANCFGQGFWKSQFLFCSSLSLSISLPITRTGSLSLSFCLSLSLSLLGVPFRVFFSGASNWIILWRYKHACMLMNYHVLCSWF